MRNSYGQRAEIRVRGLPVYKSSPRVGWLPSRARNLFERAFRRGGRFVPESITKRAPRRKGKCVSVAGFAVELSTRVDNLRFGTRVPNLYPCRHEPGNSTRVEKRKLNARRELGVRNSTRVEFSRGDHIVAADTHREFGKSTRVDNLSFSHYRTAIRDRSRKTPRAWRIQNSAQVEKRKFYTCRKSHPL